ncbi:hypothetical protein P154DRAFT_540927 [Amniculicola lignicola CBS 123094]|uniref:Uncharacterized protein n=1 Tax=Amniculicola lignicola CBS 123094 TaxID=1392246 RepID=A0A6A5VVU8_9PLEO|nr:hypothetical protein P154DRAFT_540927 [Amniculicola lignicola CBS 123094]
MSSRTPTTRRAEAIPSMARNETATAVDGTGHGTAVTMPHSQEPSKSLGLGSPSLVPDDTDSHEKEQDDEGVNEEPAHTPVAKASIKKARTKKAISIESIWTITTIKSKSNRADMMAMIREAGKNPDCFIQKGVTGIHEYCHALQVWYDGAKGADDVEEAEANMPEPEDYVQMKGSKKAVAKTPPAKAAPTKTALQEAGSGKKRARDDDDEDAYVREFIKKMKTDGVFSPWIGGSAEQNDDVGMWEAAPADYNSDEEEEVLEPEFLREGNEDEDDDEEEEEEEEDEEPDSDAEDEEEYCAIEADILRWRLKLLKVITWDDIKHGTSIDDSKYAKEHTDLAESPDAAVLIPITAQELFRQVLIAIDTLNKMVADGVRRYTKAFKDKVGALKGEWKRLVAHLVKCWEGQATPDAVPEFLHHGLGQDLQEAVEGDWLSDEGPDGRPSLHARVFRTRFKAEFPEKYRDEWLKTNFS